MKIPKQLLLIETNGRWGLIDDSGHLITALKYDKIYSMSIDKIKNVVR